MSPSLSPGADSRANPLEERTDRWLIRALSELSSSSGVRQAAAAWLSAHEAALRLGLAEEEAEMQADAAYQQRAGL